MSASRRLPPRLLTTVLGRISDKNFAREGAKWIAAIDHVVESPCTAYCFNG
jgi:hypothetical protein